MPTDQLIPAEDLSIIKVSASLSLNDGSEYVVTYGYIAVYKFEATEKKVRNIVYNSSFDSWMYLISKAIFTPVSKKNSMTSGTFQTEESSYKNMEG